MLFKKVGQAQHIALSFMADQTMHKLARDKNAHKDCPEFEQVQRDLDEYERKAIERVNNEYKANTELETRKYEANVHIINNTSRVSLDFIRFISLLKDSNLWK